MIVLLIVLLLIIIDLLACLLFCTRNKKKSGFYGMFVNAPSQSGIAAGWGGIKTRMKREYRMQRMKQKTNLRDVFYRGWDLCSG